MIRKHDGEHTLFYVDPPYPHSTRSAKRKHGALHCAYAHEMDDDAHGALLETLTSATGMVVL